MNSAPLKQEENRLCSVKKSKITDYLPGQWQMDSTPGPVRQQSFSSLFRRAFDANVLL
jgi:hypothetical protein